MRKIIYDRLSEISNNCNGYVRTGELLQGGLTNRQIAFLVEEHKLEKVSFGIYWIVAGFFIKPKDYKAIEISMTDPDAVICADSACYIHGFIDREPSRISIATRRSDRRKLDMKFDTNRFYISDSIFDEGLEKIDTKYGRFYIYGIERSICDCFKYSRKLEMESLSAIRRSLEKISYEERMMERVRLYAEMMRVRIREENDYEGTKSVRIQKI